MVRRKQNKNWTQSAKQGERCKPWTKDAEAQLGINQVALGRTFQAGGTRTTMHRPQEGNEYEKRLHCLVDTILGMSASSIWSINFNKLQNKCNLLLLCGGALKKDHGTVTPSDELGPPGIFISRACPQSFSVCFSPPLDETGWLEGIGVGYLPSSQVG